MESTKPELQTNYTTTERKTPSGKGVNRNSLSKVLTTDSVANSSYTNNQNHVGWTGDPLRGGGVLFPSLSKGTRLASNSLNNPKTTTEIIQTLTKVYPDKIMYFQFKFPFMRGGEREETTPVVDKKERTEEQINDSLESSLRRTRREIAEIVDSNDFDKFATFTFDPKKHPLCKDYEYAKKIMIKWLKNQQLTHGAFRYLIVPERQNNGNIHFHALLGGFTGKFKATNKRNKGREDERQCYKINSWESRYGFADMEDIGNKEASGKYIGKYITKDISRFQNLDNSTLNKHSEIFRKYEKRYFSSQGLKKPEKEYNNDLFQVIQKHDLEKKASNTYENNYVKVTTFRKTEDK